MIKSVADQNRERNAVRWKAYLVCMERGHTPSGFVTAGVPPMNKCKFCGSYYWLECIDRESMVPINPDKWPDD